MLSNEIGEIAEGYFCGYRSIRSAQYDDTASSGERIQVLVIEQALEMTVPGRMVRSAPVKRRSPPTQLAPIVHLHRSSIKYEHQVGTHHVQEQIRESCRNSTISSKGGSHPTHAGGSTLCAHPIFFFRVAHPIWVNMFALTTLDACTRRSSILTINKVRVRGTITRELQTSFPRVSESSHRRRCQHPETRNARLYG
jgi:hypothetical protein